MGSVINPGLTKLLPLRGLWGSVWHLETTLLGVDVHELVPYIIMTKGTKGNASETLIDDILHCGH